jgi:hypothetical protein
MPHSLFFRDELEQRACQSDQRKRQKDILHNHDGLPRHFGSGRQVVDDPGRDGRIDEGQSAPFSVLVAAHEVPPIESNT